MRQSRKKWERRREVHRNKLAAVIFVIMMIAFCVVNLATGDREFSATENRALEQRPEPYNVRNRKRKMDGAVRILCIRSVRGKRFLGNAKKQGGSAGRKEKSEWRVQRKRPLSSGGYCKTG